MGGKIQGQVQGQREEKGGGGGARAGRGLAAADGRSFTSPSSPPLAAALPDQRATVPPGQELTELVFIPSAIPRSGRQSARVTHDGGLSWQGRGHPTQFRAIQPRVVGTASLPTGPCGPQHLLRARSLVY